MQARRNRSLKSPSPYDRAQVTLSQLRTFTAVFGHELDEGPYARRVAEHCGFVYEGRFRERHRKKAGTVVDMLWYGMLLSEWQNSLSLPTTLKE